GGGDGVNFKPNYVSVMNYAFQLDGFGPGGTMDYSATALAQLDELHLNEPAGIGDGPFTIPFTCPSGVPGSGTGNVAIDWSCDVPTNATDADGKDDVNGDRVCVTAANGGSLQS